MKRVLCAWEFGGDLGHIRRLSALASGLAQSGFEPVLALADVLATPAEHFGRAVPAPRLDQEARPSLVSLNASDLLLRMGFGQGKRLVGPLRGWLALIDRLQPVAIAADFAPGALLAGRIAGLPVANVSSGFSSPLRGTPMPPFRTWQPSAPEHLQAADARLLDSVNTALRALGESPIAHPAELFAAQDDLLCTFAEIDPYGARPDGRYLGPLDHGARGEPCAWSGEDHPRILAYLKPSQPGFGDLVAAIGRVAGEALVAAPGLPAAEAARLSQGRLRVVAQPIHLDSVLEGADACIGHSGAGFTARVLAAGKPLGLLPTHVEQFLIARRVVEAGAGLLIHPDEPPPPYADWVHSLVGNDALARGAATIGARHAGHSGAEASRLAAARIAAIAH